MIYPWLLYGPGTIERERGDGLGTDVLPLFSSLDIRYKPKMPSF
jgi:hypothetical protein